ncbi:transporter substrate-binding domain-containing protein [uncultured Tateyamaria sp.]|uniref:substrate-binding periplasmic protein n=1 Tax=uncultured Tateyamaria sp. TaxID=455651 RepID=UPI002623625A|nr:transporter substrate-binding domain-containing protein [uncultured Tateyamaria sp.]
MRLWFRTVSFWTFLVTMFAFPVHAQTVDRIVAANYAPLMNEGNSERPGYAIEVLQEAARRNGRQLDITFMPFERAMLALRSQDEVLMPALFFGKRHNNEFRWLIEIHSAKLRFATISDSVDSLDAARALGSIAIESGTTADAMLSNLGFSNLVRTVSPESSSRMLAAGRVDAWFQNGHTMQQFWAQLEVSQPMTLGQTVREVPIFLVASAGLNDDVANAYKNSVEEMRDDGTLDALFENYAPNR